MARKSCRQRTDAPKLAVRYGARLSCTCGSLSATRTPIAAPACSFWNQPTSRTAVRTRRAFRDVISPPSARSSVVCAVQKAMFRDLDAHALRSQEFGPKLPSHSGIRSVQPFPKSGFVSSPNEKFLTVTYGECMTSFLMSFYNVQLCRAQYPKCQGQTVFKFLTFWKFQNGTSWWKREYFRSMDLSLSDPTWMGR